MPMAAGGLGKLVEETGELLQIAGKCLAYYTTDEHPDGKGPLSLRLEDEIADVLAAIDLVIRVRGLSRGRISQRWEEKKRLFNAWHDSPSNNEHGVDAAPRFGGVAGTGSEP